MKYVNIRIPEPGPLGETLFDASVRAIVGASFVKRPSGGCVESVSTLATHCPVLFFGILAKLRSYDGVERLFAKLGRRR
jgi:hypothetical protein